MSWRMMSGARKMDASAMRRSGMAERRRRLTSRPPPVKEAWAAPGGRRVRGVAMLTRAAGPIAKGRITAKGVKGSEMGRDGRATTMPDDVTMTGALVAP